MTDLTQFKSEKKPAPNWAYLLLVLSLVIVGCAAIFGTFRDDRIKSFMVIPSELVGALYGASQGACVGLVMVTASLLGGGWRSKLFLPAASTCIIGSVLAYRIYGFN